ncbi:cytochrome c class I [Chthoniobacter flavus Ellin428]|uniref:Cytochrome c class I n=1 Tax=Chthoniobacter flavus Ellin428 TaxID=497964 RepID=B4D0T1_9BACT|nr:cytochrome c class I [Chthoniobacter flavus Ellin428]TCO91786.1 mono/diheme cytochrome c family protein [Chthoniobacter flavus]
MIPFVLRFTCFAVAFTAALSARPVEASPAGGEPEARVGPDISLYGEGKFVYENNCIVCHGTMGDGRGEMAASLGIKPRSFKTGTFKYRSTPWGKLPTTEDLTHTVRGGITGTAMGMFTSLNDEQLRAVVEYVKFFSRKWRKAENYAPPIELPKQPAWMADDIVRTSHAAKGKETFEAVCAACHGPKGDGKGLAAMGLKDEWGELAVPADLRQPHLRSGDEPDDIFRVLMTGLNGTPMVSFAEALTEEQKWDLVAYVLTLRRDFNAAGK